MLPISLSSDCSMIWTLKYVMYMASRNTENLYCKLASLHAVKSNFTSSGQTRKRVVSTICPVNSALSPSRRRALKGSVGIRGIRGI